MEGILTGSQSEIGRLLRVVLKKLLLRVFSPNLKFKSEI